MIHKNKNDFLQMLEGVSARTGFSAGLLEKDYYLTLLLSKANEELDDNLVFKGGTCLAKNYFDYFRLSEDLDFTIPVPEGKVTKKIRSRLMEKVKSNLKKYISQFGLTLDPSKQQGGHNESRQYVYYFNYEPVVSGSPGVIKFEIGLRAPLQMAVVPKPICHKFTHPFTGEPLFDAGRINCLQLTEIAAEKMRAAATRKVTAPRDFFDLSHFIKAGFSFADDGFLKMFKTKLGEDGHTADTISYFYNLNRTKEQIEIMKKNISEELSDVLTLSAASDFDVDAVFVYFNSLHEKLSRRRL
jgi:predicted nucleotidyltransferase component of viral defense system